MSEQPEQFTDEQEEARIDHECPKAKSSMTQCINRQSLASALLFACVLLALLFALLTPAVAQGTQPVLTPEGLLFRLQNPTGVVSSASITRLGNPGKSTVYYWIVTNSLVGQGAAAGPFTLSNAPAVFSTSYALASGSYTSGITATGSIGQTCTLTNFNHGSTARATVTLTGHNAIAGGTALVFEDFGSGATAASTTATASNGSAACSGTATVSTVLGHNYSTGAQINWTAVNGATTYDCLKTSTAALPSGTGSYAVATGLTGTTCNDTGAGLSSYTVSPVNVAGLRILVQNQATSEGESCLAANSVCIAGYVPPTYYYQYAQNAGTALPQEPAYDFTGIATATDDPTNHRTVVNVPAPEPFPALYYQTAVRNGVSYPQREALAFSTDFNLADDIPSNSTDVSLPVQLSAGTYCQVTVNTKGIVTAASACPIDLYFSFTSCTIPSLPNNYCLGTSPSYSMPDANYVALCGALNTTQFYITDATLSTSSFNYEVLGGGATLPTTVTVMCHLHHN
jgi:hypothetical protein